MWRASPPQRAIQRWSVICPGVRTAPSFGQRWSRVLTVEELNRDLPRIIADYNERFSHGKPCPLYDDVKDYAGSCADLEQLYDAMWWAGEGGIYAETE